MTGLDPPTFAVDTDNFYLSCAATDPFPSFKRIADLEPHATIDPADVTHLWVPSEYGTRGFVAALTGPVLLSGDELFFVERDGISQRDDKIRRMGLCQTRWAEVVVSLNDSRPLQIAANASYIYWTDGTVVARVAR
jgi:hypothetical protein